MDDVKIELNSEGVRELLKSSDMQKMLREKANEIQGRAGSNYSAECRVLSTRAVAFVESNGIDGILDNRKNNTLLKAVR